MTIEISVHGGTSSGSTKINLEFNIRRANNTGSQRQSAPSEADFNYDLDGQAFVPPDLVNENNSDGSTTNTPNNESLLHPQHIQRTEELRAQAAVVREQQALNSQEESFPTLQAGGGPSSSSAPLVGWASGTALSNINRTNRNRNVGEVNQESFPTLPTNTSNSNKKKKAIRGNIGATRRQFAAMSTSANNPQQQAATWGASSSSASATVTRQMNRQSDLSAANFPSLGGPSTTRAVATPSYPPRRAMGSAPPPSMNSASDFPSMSAASSISRATKKKAPPSMNSVMDFPAPPSAKPASKPSLRQQMFGETQDRKPPPENNFLQADNLVSAASAKATVEDMKASLGQKNFKQLKKLTKTFAQDQVAPEGYVDQAATLFDRGYEDADFWAYLPSLLQSCPNQGSAQHALKYMNSLKRQQVQPTEKKAAAPKVASSKWSGGASNASNVMRQVAPPPMPAAYAAARTAAASIPPAYASAPRSLTQAAPSRTIASKKKSAWGGGGKTTVVRTKAPPGSVGAAAASQGPQGGSATKYMAKQAKKEKQAKINANNNNNGQQTKAKKKKQKNELRDLAFGK